MNSSQISKNKPRTRHRVQFSCFACKKRKVKCDRGRPHCNVCISRKTTDNCYYPSSNSKTSQINIFHINKEIGDNNNSNDSSHSTISNNTENSISDLNSIQENDHILYKDNTTKYISTEIKLIKEKLTNIENSIDIDLNTKIIKERVENLLFHLNIDIDEKFNIYSDYKPMFYFVSRINGYGPLAWIALIMKDPFSQPVLENILFEKFNNLKVSEIFYNHCLASTDIHDKTEYENLKNEKQNYEEYLASNILQPKKKIIENLTYRELINVFPNKKIIWLLIDRFFKFVYPFAPYVDQNSCLKQMQKILKLNKTNDLNSKEDKIKFIDIKNKLDLANIGCILIMLKLSYKTLIIINNGESSNLIRTNDEIYLKNHPLDDRIIDVVNYILESFDLKKRCSFPFYQLALLLKFYQKIDGEDLSSQNECKISDSILFQMAFSLGMNRDPSKFVEPSPFSLYGSLGRKIWHCLVSIDNFKYFHEGIPKSIVDSFCDTKLPEFDEKNSNNNDLKIEKLTIKLIHLRNEIETSMKPIADAICNIDNPPTVSYIMNLIENFEEKLLNKFGLFCELLDKPHQDNYYLKLSKVSEALILLEGVSLIFTVVLHLSLKFESMKLFSPSRFFSNKILTFIMIFIKLIPNISLSSHNYFGSGFDYVIIPTLEIIICKSMVFITSNYVKFSIFKQKLLRSTIIDSERLPLVEKILHTFLYDIFNNRHLKVLKILSSSFFFAWRILKVQSYIFNLLKNEILSYENQGDIFNFVEHLTSDDLIKILQLINLNNYQADTDLNCNYFNAINKQYREDICDEDPRSKEFFLDLNIELQKDRMQLYQKMDSSNRKTINDYKNNLLLNSNEENTNEIFGSLLSAEDDKFWIEMFEHNKASNQQNDIFRILDNLDSSHKNDTYHTDILFQDTQDNVVVDISNQNNKSDSKVNISSGTDTQPFDSFIDQAIFDLLF